MGTFPPTSAAGNFGNDQVGGDYFDMSADWVQIGSWTLGSVEQYTDTIRFYGRSTDASPHNGKAIICDASENLIAVGDPSTISTSNEWQTLAFSSNVTLEADTVYFLGLISDYTVRVYYEDQIYTSPSVLDSSNSYTTPTNPADGADRQDREYSIYAVTYDELPILATRQASEGAFTGTGEVNTWEATKSKDGTDWYGDVSCTLTLTFPIRSDTYYFEYHVYAYKEGVVSGATVLEVYNFVSKTWFNLATLTESPAWYNGSLENPAFMDLTNNVTMLRLDSDFLFYPRWDYADIKIYYGPHPVWHEINDAEFIFPIEWDPAAQFGYDMFFIALGLIMIPASTVYLVRGGRKEMSSDKLFYTLIIFFIGLGLLIGGIMP